MKNIYYCTLILLISLLMALPASAGSSQAGDETFFEAERIIQFSKKVEKYLAKNGARVAIVARTGRPRKDLPKGVFFTHVGIAVYSKIKLEDGRSISGYAMHNLYQQSDKPDQSFLLQDYPVDFFSGIQVLEAGIVIPKPDVQMKILKVLTSDTYQQLHNPNYSVIANPFTVELQNCTEHTLDVIFAAIYQTSDIKQIKINQKAYFQAQPVNVNPFLLALGSIFTSEVALSDHPDAPVTTTFTTIGNFLTQFDLASKSYTINEATQI